MKSGISEKSSKKFTFDDESKEIESISASSAVCMAIMEKIGIVDYIDENTKWDRNQRVLSPGNAIKAICGPMFTNNLKKALVNVSGFYGYAPVDLLFGDNVTLSSLNDVALGRAMDTVYDADPEVLYYGIAARAKFVYQFITKIAHFDGSNITITRDPTDLFEELEDEDLQPRFGYPKDGHNERLQYNFEGVADDNGLPIYFKTHSGNITDNQMDMDALTMMCDYLCDNRIVAVADCKLIDEKTVDYLIWNNIPFVSKCPENFSDKIKEDVINKAMSIGFKPIGKVGKRKDAPSYEICDLKMVANGDMLRFVAYRESDLVHSLKYYQTIVLRSVNKEISQLERKVFACKNDAILEINRKKKFFDSTPYDVSFSVSSEIVVKKRNGRGRPKLNEIPPEDVEEWHVSCVSVFNESRALEMAKRRDIRVIITSLPNSEEDCEDIVDGCTGETVLRIYLNQYKIENIFGEMKSKLGADKVFFETPKREAVMLFSIAVSVLVRRIIQLLLRKEYGKGFGIPKNITIYRMFNMIQNTAIRLDRDAGRMYFDGPSFEKDDFKTFLRVLEIEPEDLIG